MFEFIANLIVYIIIIISNIFKWLFSAIPVIGGADEELEHLQRMAAGCTFEYIPTNANIKKYMGFIGDEVEERSFRFKVVSYSLSLQDFKKEKYEPYVEGIINNVRMFPCIFDPKEWILRIYIEGSRAQDGSEEWEYFLKILGGYKHVQLVVVGYPTFMPKNPSNKIRNIGHFLSCTKFFPIFDDDVELFVSRDINAYVSEVDKYYIDKWIESNEMFLLYRYGNYGMSREQLKINTEVSDDFTDRKLSCIARSLRSACSREEFKFFQQGRFRDMYVSDDYVDLI